MSTESRSQLKTYFETGDCPTEQQFCNFIESTLNLRDDCVFIPVPPVGQPPKVGIGTPLPQHKLDVTGDLKTDEFIMPTGAMSGYVLTTDASGYATWEPAPGGGGGTKLISLEYSKVFELKAKAELDPGCIYCIPDAGTNNDQMVLVTAVSDDELSLQGAIVARNADYQAVGNYSGVGGGKNIGIWYNTLRANWSSDMSDFRLGEEITADTSDGQSAGILIAVEKDSITITKATGSWKGPATVVGQTTGAVTKFGADSVFVSELSPTKEDIVIWNNKHYKNLTGQNGNPPNLDPTNWELIPIDTREGGYITEVDFIEYEFQPKVEGYHGNGWIQRRTDKRGNDIMHSSAVDLAVFKAPFSYLDVFKWGSDNCLGNISHEGIIDNQNDRSVFNGNIVERGSIVTGNCGTPQSEILGNRVDGVNAKMQDNMLLAGAAFSGNTVGSSAILSENYIGEKGSLVSNSITSKGNILSNIIGSGSKMTSNMVGSQASIADNTLGVNSTSLSSNILEPYSVIFRNELNGEATSIVNNSLAVEARIDTNTINSTNGAIARNALGPGASIANSTLNSTQSTILKCNLGVGASIQSLTLEDQANVSYLTMGGQASFSSNSFEPGTTLSHTTIATGIRLDNKTLEKGMKIDLCHFGCDYVGSETISTPLLNKRCEPGYSNFEGTVDADAGIQPTAIDLADPANYMTEIAGIITLNRSVSTDIPKTIDSIFNMGELYPIEFRGQDTKKFNLIHTTVASATGGKFTLEGGLDFELVGRTNGSDFMKLRNDGGTIRQVDASKLS